MTQPALMAQYSNRILWTWCVQLAGVGGYGRGIGIVFGASWLEGLEEDVAEVGALGYVFLPSTSVHFLDFLGVLPKLRDGCFGALVDEVRPEVP